MKKSYILIFLILWESVLIGLGCYQLSISKYAWGVFNVVFHGIFLNNALQMSRKYYFDNK